MDVVVREADTWVEIRDARDVRRRVFIEEQGIPAKYESCTVDAYRTHWVAMLDGVVIGTTRIYRYGTSMLRVERFAVLKEYRRSPLKVGTKLIAGIELHAAHEGLQGISLNAQCHAIPFYEKCGYLKVGEPFRDAGILHQGMEKNLWYPAARTHTYPLKRALAWIGSLGR